MKKFLFSLLCVGAVLCSKAQLVTSFSTEHDKFVKELTQYMTAGKMDANIQTMETFQKMLKEGKISSTWLDQIIITSNLMVGRLMAPYPHFHHYLNTVINASKAGKTDAQFTDWSNMVGEVINHQKKGDNNNFVKFIDFSNGFFQENALNVTPSKSWRVETGDYKFVFEDDKPHISIPTTTLYGCVKGDTLSIKQTSGDYYPLETKWYGKSGKVDWGRAGLDGNKVYCTFKEYSINFTNFNYTIDTVSFNDAEYFNKPLTGKLIDKMVSNADSNSMSYPRFISYDGSINIKDFAPNVSYSGGFSLFGSKVRGAGSADSKAQLTFFARDGKTKVMSVWSNTLTIKKGEQLGAEKAEVSIYFGSDSIYHPQLNVVYKVQKREMRLLRGETGLGKAKFTDSYHNDEFQTDAIFWNLDSSVLNLKILSGVGQKPGIYESTNYFSKELIRKTQGFVSYEPLSILKKLYEKTASRDINVIEYARALDPNLKEDEVKSLLYQLVENGFILYNEEAGVITVKDKTINYVLANSKKIDYDIITIRSAPKTGNDYIDLKSADIDLKGVKVVPISDTAVVSFRPKNNSISLQKDRNMLFDGLIYAGRMDLIGEKHKFNYLPFTVDLTKVDTMRINVPDSNKVDENGNPILKPTKSKVENLKGLLEIDAPINKSGRTRLPQFPRLYSREKSYIYYDDTATAKGAYNRKTFFFELEPFRLDSLNSFDPSLINWKGKLESGGIFPDIQDSVHLQDDASLGFKSETPPGGYDLYKGKGKYYGKFQLDYTGLSGDARITHSTADFTSHDVRLYPDSMRATTDTFTLKKTFEGVKTPSVLGQSDMIFWKPTSDSMYISMNDPAKPFAMYDDSFTSFKGSLLLTDKGLRGNGTLDWDQATLSSKDIAFRTMDLSSDTASLNIKTSGDRVSFKTPNVSAKVDFKTRIGDFKSNQLNIPTEFSYNQYTTAINEFKWYMDEKILDFKAPPAGPGEYFTSTRPDQKGLKFLGKRAIYNLVSSVLRIEQVPEIKVADASVVPDSGVVVIEGEAKMHQLRNAVIYADTIKKAHKFDNAVVDIYSKEDMKAIGDYHYDTKGIKEIINFQDIGCKSLTEGKHKNEHQIWQLVAKSNVEESQNFVLYPDVKYHGEVNILSINPTINFKGYAQIGLKNPQAATSDFFINQEVDPNNLGLKYNEETKSSNNNKLSVGIHLNPAPDVAQMYTTLLSPKKDEKDVTVFKSTGIVTQLSTGEYVFGDEKKIKDNSMSGNVLKYDDKKGTVKAEGLFQLGTNFGMIKSIAAGTGEVRLDSGKYKFNLTLGVDAKIDDKTQERLEFHLAGDDGDAPDLTYETDKQKKAIYSLSDEKEDKKMLEEFDKTSAFVKRPKNLDHNLVFSDVTFVFDPQDVSLRSVGKIGVAMVGKKPINKKLEGYIEIQYKGGADVFTIYLQTSTKDWFYYEYHPGILDFLTSYDDMTKLISPLTPDKRRVKGDKGRFYMYELGNSSNKSDFVEYMKDRANGVVRARPEPKFEAPVLIDTSSIPENTAPGDTANPEKKQQMKQQQEINQIEQMKSSGGSILSGPPPDRKKGKKKKGEAQEEQQQQDSVPVNKEEIQQQQNYQQMEQMKNSGGSIFSAPPPDRKKADEPVKDTVPVKQETPPPPPAETPKQEPVKQEPPKQEVTPPVQEAPKQEPAKQEPVKQEPTPPVQEAPKQEPAKQEAVPAKEEPKQDAPKEEPKEGKKKKKNKKEEKQDAEQPQEAPKEQPATPPAPTTTPTDSVPH